MKYFLALLFLTMATSQYSMANGIQTGFDEESSKDMVLLNGIMLNIENRNISFDKVTPLCQGKRTFYIRYQDPQVPLNQGEQIWFWLIGSCGHVDDVIDIVAKPQEENK